MAEVVLKDVGKVYSGGVAAVREFSLAIPDGAFVVLVGPSGCGKSTTLRMIAGLEDVSSGTISIGGRVVNDVHPKDRDIAMVFQSYALYPHMTVYKNMAFALKMRRVERGEIDRRVRAAAGMLGITELLDRKPRQLSGGQKQRVAVGRAIVREPKAFLFDEPLSNLDAKLRVSTRAELKALHARLKTTTVYVTHDQEEAMTLGDLVVVLAGGEIQQVGAPLEVYRRPVNRFVAGFVGMPGMNFVEGRVEKDGGGVVFVEKGSGGGVVRLGGGVGDRAGGLVGRGAVLGVRPQALSLGGAEGTGLAATVEVVEPLGDQVDVVCVTAAGTRVVARVSADGVVRVGERVRLGVDMERVHIFEEGEFGRNVVVG